MVRTRARVRPIVLGTATLVWTLSLCAVQAVHAQTGTLAEPFSPPSPNAALHYQRALLLLTALDTQDERVLRKPVWEVSTFSEQEEFSGHIKRLLYRARHATQAAAKGSRLEMCDFGIDFRDAGSATVLPHVEPMTRLGRLLTLRGAYSESQGKWDEAAVIYFDGLRMGQHMTHGRTLLEAMAGMQILENNYYALAKWSLRCPQRDLVARAFGLLETMEGRLVNPSRTLASEASILALELDQLRATFPRGAWGSLILESLEKEPVEDEAANRKAAVAACVELGVPKETFSSVIAFREYLEELETISQRFAESVAACMRLEGVARVQRGARLSERYAKRLGALGQEEVLDVAQLGALFASHEAKLTLLRCTLAVSARKTKTGYPAQLDAVAGGFGGELPVSPYDGQSVAYETYDDGKSFGLRIPAKRVAGLLLPEVDFSSAEPKPLQDESSR